MAYASNAFVRRNAGNKVSVHLIFNDVDGMFKDLPEEGFVMAHTEAVGGSPMILLNGEQCSADGWMNHISEKSKSEDFERKPGRLWGYTVSQLSTMPIWICKKVLNLFS